MKRIIICLVLVMVGCEPVREPSKFKVGDVVKTNLGTKGLVTYNYGEGRIEVEIVTSNNVNRVWYPENCLKLEK